MQENKDPKTFTIFQTLYLSFFSRVLYQDVRRNWKASAALPAVHPDVLLGAEMMN